MKSRNIVLLLLFLSNYCYQPDQGDKYSIGIKGETFQRSGYIKLEQAKLESCLINYNWDNHQKSHVDTARGFIGFYFKPIIENEKHVVTVGLEGFSKFENTDGRLRPMVEKENCKYGGSKPYKKLKDVAFIDTECRTDGWAGILYSNWFIQIGVTPFGEAQPRIRQTDDYKKLKKEILLAFLDDFYPYFMQCAEQAAVPVQESRK